ncbi:MAG TPA: ribonuclease HIII [Bacilli bacterium]|nr:ribonuclease HIII [Bacilli bacterium]
MPISYKLTQNQANLIIKHYKKYSTTPTNNYTLFLAKNKPEFTITIYTNLTLLIQGAKEDETHNKISLLIGKTIEHSIIGSDEVGTGDFFGGVVVCAAFIDSKDLEKVKALGVKDSKVLTDTQINKIAQELIKIIPYEAIILSPTQYNKMIASGNNLNKIKALMHNKALLTLSKKVKYDQIIIDKFASEKNYYSYLEDQKEVIKEKVSFLEKGESKILSIAAASIIARYLFNKQIDDLSNLINFKLPKGAGSIVDKAINELKLKYGNKIFDNIGKTHFKNLKK